MIGTVARLGVAGVGGYATPTLVQSTSGTGASTAGATFAAPCTAGNTIVAYASTTGTPSGVTTDVVGGSMAAVGSNAVDATVSTNIYRGTALGGEQLIQATGSGGTAYIIIQEWAGLSTTIEAGPTTGAAGASATALSPAALPSITTTHPATLLAAVGAGGNRGTASWTSEALTLTGVGSVLFAGHLSKPPPGTYATTPGWTTPRRASGIFVALRAKAV